MVSLKSMSSTTVNLYCAWMDGVGLQVLEVMVALNVQVPSGQQPPGKPTGGALPCVYVPASVMVTSQSWLPSGAGGAIARSAPGLGGIDGLGAIAMSCGVCCCMAGLAISGEPPGIIICWLGVPGAKSRQPAASNMQARGLMVGRPSDLHARSKAADFAVV